MRNTSETDYDVIKYNLSAQTGILNSLVTGLFLSWADHTYLRKMYRSFCITLFHSPVSLDG